MEKVVKKKITVKVRIVVEKDGDQFYAYAPDLKGVHAPGETREEALKFARESVCLYLVSLLKHGEPLPLGAVIENDFSPIQRAADWFRGAFIAGRKKYIEEIRIPAAA